MLTGLLDTLLDRAVVPGYSRLGYLARQRRWDELPEASLRGRTVAITGANSGLGKAAAAGAARLGAHVQLLCRDAARGESARVELLAAHPDAQFDVQRCDLSDPASVRACAAAIGDQPLHGLVHNAGVLPPQRTETADGHELTLATHVLGPHLLTHLLRTALAADGDARVVFVSSGGMYTQALPVDDCEYANGTYRGASAYARTKRMQVVLAELWATELEDDATTVHSMHPGWAATPGITQSLPGFGRVTGPILRTPDQGADTVAWLLASAQAGERSGLFWHDRVPRPTSYLGWHRVSSTDARRLWQFCVNATGVPG